MNTTAPNVVQLYTLVRIFGSNVFTLDGLYKVLVLEGPLFSYILGLLAPLVVLIFIFAAWQFVLWLGLQTPSYRKSSNATMIALYVMTCIFSTISMLGFLLALAANTELSEAVGAMQAKLGLFTGASGLLVNATSAIVTDTATMDGLLTSLNTACSGHPRVAFPTLPTVSNPVFALGLGLFQTMGPLIATGNLMLTRLFVQFREPAVYGIVIPLLLVHFFGLIFMLQARKEDSVASTYRKSGAKVVLGIHVFLGIAFWLILALVHVLGTVGSDVCLPTVDQNVNRLLNEYIYSSPTEALGNGSIVQGAKRNPCTDDAVYPMTLVGGSLCYFQTCNGANPLGAVGLQVATNAGGALTYLGQFQAALVNDSSFYPNGSVSNPATCFGGLQTYGASGQHLFANFQSLGNLTDCPTLKTTYQSIVHTSFCNQVVNKSGQLLFTGVVGLVFGMLFLIFFQMLVYQKWVEADFVPPVGGKVAGEETDVLNPVYKEEANKV